MILEHGRIGVLRPPSLFGLRRASHLQPTRCHIWSAQIARLISRRKIMSRIERILIVGAGMAGLALAISLRRQGVSPHIVERQQDWSVPGAGIYLVGNAMRALGSLGLTEEVRQGGALIRTQTILDDRGRRLAVIDTERV
jgi:hypothetical protein